MKKVFAILLSAGLFMAVAVPALACEDNDWSCRVRQRFNHRYCRDCRDINRAEIYNTVMSTADTGGNSQRNLAGCDDVDIDDVTQTLISGNAYAEAKALVEANQTGDCMNGMPCLNGFNGGYMGLPRLETNYAEVYNTVMATAKTGDNHQVNRAWNGEVEIDDSQINLMSGNAQAISDAWSLVNVSME